MKIKMPNLTQIPNLYQTIKHFKISIQTNLIDNSPLFKTAYVIESINLQQVLIAQAIDLLKIKMKIMTYLKHWPQIYSLLQVNLLIVVSYEIESAR